MSDRNLEEEYFQRLDAERRAALQAKIEAESEDMQAEERKKLHFHKCGKCGSDMSTLGFRGVEIEQCGACGSVLLDPGELEELAGDDQSGVISNFLSVFSR